MTITDATITDAQPTVDAAAGSADDAAALSDRVAALAADFRSGAWVPAPLERCVCGILTAAVSADGRLTPGRIRSALWDGAVAITQENGARVAKLLASTIEVLEGAEPVDAAAVESVRSLAAAIAG
jgi:hypothetical protein